MLTSSVIGFLSFLVAAVNSYSISFLLGDEFPSCVVTRKEVDIIDIASFGIVDHDPDVSSEELKTINQNIIEASKHFKKYYPLKSVIQHIVTVEKCNCEVEDSLRGRGSAKKVLQKQVYTEMSTTIEGLPQPISFKYPSRCSLELNLDNL